MENNHIWSVTVVSGAHCNSHIGLTKEQAKEIFSKLAADTTRNINNDYIALIIMDYRDKKLYGAPVKMERIGKGKYRYRFGKKSTKDGHEAWEIIQRL